MRPLSASDLLKVWEDGQGVPRAPIGVLLLQAACPEEPPEELARKSIGQRDAILLRLRELMFGPQLDCFAGCPWCATPIEFSLETAGLLLPEGDPGAGPLQAHIAGHQVTFRLPAAADLAALDAGGALDGGPEALARRLVLPCILSVRKDDLERAPDELPAEVLEAVADAMAEADPQADLRFAATCPSCRYEWSAVLDIVAFLWHEIDSWARRTLQDVHTLASAYGWSEDQILRLSPRRRRCYLELIAG